jgi:glycopeptide antibiotics resistance protein
MKSNLGVIRQTKTRTRPSGLTIMLFVVYLIILIWAILWKFEVPYIGDGSLRVINLVPYSANTIPELRLNILIFIPFGLYISMLATKSGIIKRILIILLTSALLETLQYVLAIGHTDITDLINNTLGGIIGIIIFYIVSKLFGRYANKVLLVVCAIATIAVLAVAVYFVLFPNQDTLVSLPSLPPISLPALPSLPSISLPALP